MVDRGALIRALAQIHPAYFLTAFALNALGTVLVRAWVAHLTTRASGLLLSFGELVKINLIARFYTIVLPRGASTAIRWQHYRKGGTGHAAAALLMFENLVSIFTLFLSAAVMLWLELDDTSDVSRILLPIAWLGTLCSIIVLLLFVSNRAATIAARIFQPLSRRRGRLSGLISRLLSAVNDYQSISLRQASVILFASFLGYLFFVLSAWILAQGMAINVSLIAIAWIRSVTLLLALIPVTVAGIGLREGAFIVLLQEYGVSASVAFAYALSSFAIQLMLGLLGAVLEMFRILNSTRMLKKKPNREVL